MTVTTSSRRSRRPLRSLAVVAISAALALVVTGAAHWRSASAAAVPVVTIWGSDPPTSAVVDPDTNSVELGTRFTATTAGEATAIRFYKTPENAGPHTGSLWTSSGALLAQVDFTGESSSGWQSAALAHPVALTAGSSYVVSYHTEGGHYASTEYFSGQSATPDLRVPTSDSGVYSYGGGSSFPTDTWHSSQYWVDIAFIPGMASAPTTTASTTSSPASTGPVPTPSGGSPSPTSSMTTTPSATGTTTTPTATTTTPTATTATSTPAPTSTVLYEAPRASSSPTTGTPSSSPSATTSSSPTGSSSGSSSTGMTDCVSLPSRCGYPDATNTGVPSGTTLRRVPQDVTSGPGWTWDSRGWIQTTSGAVVSNLIVSGSIDVSGSNVTVKDNRILQDGQAWGIGLQHTVNATISDNEIGILGGTPRLLVGIKDVYGDCTGTQILRNNIQNTSTGIQVHEGLIADNYVHDMGFETGDHLNGTTSNGATTPMTIRHNTILNQFGQTDAISLFQDFGLEANRVVTDNLIAGGGYTIYAGGGSKGTSYNIQITNNRFSTLYFRNGGSYGPVTAFDSAGSGNVWSGNYWDKTLAPVNN